MGCFRYVTRDSAKKIAMRRQKRITFKKKFIEKYLFFDEISHFQEQKSATFPQNPGNFQWEINGNRFSFLFNFHWFSIENYPDFWGNVALFCSWKWPISSKNKYFPIFFESYSFLTPHRYFFAESHVT